MEDMLETLDANKVIPELNSYTDVVGLPDGGALVSTYTKVFRLDEKGGIKVLITVSGRDNYIYNLLHLPVSDEILLIQRGNLKTRIKVTDGKMVKKYQSNICCLLIPLDNDTFIANDLSSVFTYPLSDQHKEVKIKGMQGVNHVSYGDTTLGRIYVVCERNTDDWFTHRPRFHIFDSFWKLKRTIDVTKHGIYSAVFSVVLPNNRILIVPTSGSLNMYLFSLPGDFIKTMRIPVNKEESQVYIKRVSYQHPDLWLYYRISSSPYTYTYFLKRFQLFKTSIF